MKLLASLLGCAVADYACCPYDDFGVVNPHCPLTEKTPWAMQNANANSDPEGVSDHICKAWEANIDATMEGNEDGDNWGGCGFQRHFPWAMTHAINGGSTPAAPATLEHCRMGVFDCTAGVGNPMVNKYMALKAGSIAFPLSTGGFSAQHTNDVFGQVTLGGVCKLWIPVLLNSIDSVSIAGVHMNGGGTAGDPGHLAVFDGAEVCEAANCVGNTVAGTAFCFSVVNVAEFMENNMPGSAFRVMNANVAGKDIGGGDPIRLEGNTFEGEFPVDFGSSIEPANEAGGGGTIVDAGASFDVVVHFKSAWCIRHWTLVDMQTDPDWGSQDVNGDDYPLMDDGNSNPQHAHTDVADKRFDGQVGICGCCDGLGTTRHDAASHLANDPSADTCTPCTTGGCVELNTYGAGVVDMKWPNAGAWAAYHSFITCSDNEFMIYNGATGITGGNIDVNDNARIVVHSMFYNDVRHDYSNAHEGTGTVVIRGNFRQAGSKMTNCGPGVIDTADNMRCTWNWNFMLNAGKDEEEWFNRDSPQSFAVWKDGAAVSRNDEADTHAATGGMISDIVETHTFVADFQAWDTDLGSGSTGNTHSMSIDASKYFSDPNAAMVVNADKHEFTFTMHCLESSLDGNGAIILGGNIGDDNTQNVRDIFPDCYMGDEIHFSYTIAGGASGDLDHRISAWFSSVTATSF